MNTKHLQVMEVRLKGRKKKTNESTHIVKFPPLVVKILYYKFIALITKSTFKISWKSAHGATHLSTSDSWNRPQPPPQLISRRIYMGVIM